MGIIRDKYRQFSDQRQPFLDQAALNERWTIQLGGAMEHHEIQQRRPELVSAIGQKANRSLAATKTATLLPPNVAWMRMVLDAKDPKLKGSTSVQAALAAGERSTMQLFERTRCRSQLFNAFLHANICGQVVYHLKQEDDRGPDRARLVPFRKFVMRWEDGFNTDIILREEMKRNPDDPDERPIPFWTHIDYVNDRIRQEFGDTEQVVDVDDGDNPRRYFVVTSEAVLPDFHYAFAYTTHWLSQIIHSNGLTRAIANIVYEAAMIIKAVRQGSGLDPHKLAGLTTGAWIMMRRMDDIGYPQQNSPLVPGLAIVVDERQKTDEQVDMAFLHGVLDTRPLPNTATLAEIMAGQQANIAQQFYAHDEAFTMNPLAIALMDLGGIQVEGPAGRIEPSILTGLSALSRADETQRLANNLITIAQIAPEWVQGLPMNRIFQRLNDGAQVETGDLVPDNASFMDALREVAGGLQTDPRQNMPTFIKFIQSLDPQILSDVAGEIGGDDQPQQLQLPPGSQEAVA